MICIPMIEHGKKKKLIIHVYSLCVKLNAGLLRTVQKKPYSFINETNEIINTTDLDKKISMTF